MSEWDKKIARHQWMAREEDREIARREAEKETRKLKKKVR